MSRVRRHSLRRRAVLVSVAALLIQLVGLAGTQPERADAALSDVPAAITDGVNNAASKGITQYVAVMDRATGQLVGSTANATTQVASESVMKLFIAAYYLRQYGGNLPTQMHQDLWYMVAASDDAIASRYWTANAIPSIANVYGLTGSSNDPTRPGYWGAARITARDMATFLWRASQDPAVGSWLFSAMANATNNGSDGFNQNFGFNAINGAGSKQGWGCDSYWRGPCAIHSVGFTGDVVAAVLQTAPTGLYNAMPATATYTAQKVASAAAYKPPSLPGRDNPEGDFGMWVQGGTLYLDGWAFDGSNLLWNVPVTVTANGQAQFTTTAAMDSPNLHPYGIPGKHRFFAAWSIPNTGNYEICIQLGNTGAGSAQKAKCLQLSVPANPARDDPAGSISATVAYDGTITVTGYAYDPSSYGQSIPGWLTNNGSLAATPYANQAQPSLAPYGIGGNHGIRYQYKAPGTGDHEVCFYAINIGWGQNQWVDCAPVSFPRNVDRDDPHGDFTVVQSTGQIVVAGWSFDKNNLYASTRTMFTLDGKPVISPLANQPSDYLYAYGVPGRHGLYGGIAAAKGQHQVCMFSYNIDYGNDVLHKCSNVTVT